MAAGLLVQVCGERPADSEPIREVVAACFARGDGTVPPEVALVDDLRAAPEFDPALSFVVMVDGVIAGHLLFTPIRIETRGGDVPALALAPLAVVRGYERLHLGTALMHAGLSACRERGHWIVIVLGHPKYYARFGFVPARARGVAPPSPWPDAAFRVLELRPGALEGVVGTARYPAAFDA